MKDFNFMNKQTQFQKMNKQFFKISILQLAFTTNL